MQTRMLPNIANNMKTDINIDFMTISAVESFAIAESISTSCMRFRSTYFQQDLSTQVDNKVSLTSVAHHASNVPLQSLECSQNYTLQLLSTTAKENTFN